MAYAPLVRWAYAISIGDAINEAESLSVCIQPGFRQGGLKQFHRIARRIVHENLPAAGSSDDVVPKMHASLPQSVDERLQIIDFDGEPVPSAWFLHLAVGH